MQVSGQQIESQKWGIVRKTEVMSKSPRTSVKRKSKTRT
jgi:hypothetical protein